MSNFVKIMVLADGYILLRYKLLYSMYIYSHLFIIPFFLYFLSFFPFPLFVYYTHY